MAEDRRLARIVLSVAVSLFFLYLTFWVPHLGSLLHGNEGITRALFGHGRFDLTQLWNAIVAARWALIVLISVLYILGLIWRAWRWHLLMRPLCSIRYGQAFAAMMVGYMANNLLPLRMGELYRAQVVWQICGLSRSSALGTVVLERTLDLFFFLPFVAGSILFFPLPPAFRQMGTIVAIGILLLVAFLLWMIIQKKSALAVVRAVFSIGPARLQEKAVGLLDKFTSGLSALTHSRLWVLLTIQSLVLWCLYWTVTYLMLVAMHLAGPETPIIANDPMAASLVLLVITTVGFCTPSAPGAVGTYHGVTVLGLSLLGVPGDQAAGFAILLHALNFIPLTGMGLFFFWQQGLSFRRPTSAETNSKVPQHSR